MVARAATSTAAMASAPAAIKPARGFGSPITAPVAPADITDWREPADIAEPNEPTEAIENADAPAPTEPIESAEPTEPIERTEPFEQIGEQRVLGPQRELRAVVVCRHVPQSLKPRQFAG